MPDAQVETIAFVLAGLPPEEQQRLLTDAFNHCLAKRPDLTDYELDPRVVQLVADIFLRVAAIERERGCPSH